MGRVYARLATGLGWTYPQIDQLTLPEAYEIFEHWRDFPPPNELLKMMAHFERELTTEEKIEQGAMGPMDFLRHAERTKGKVVNDA